MEIKPGAQLIDHSENPERNVALAARLCYSKKGAKELDKELNLQQIKKMVKKVIELGHTSTLEHTYFYFRIQCSRVTSHQLVRQRIGVSYSQRSQRYVTEDNFDYIVPPSLKKNEQALHLFREKMKEMQEVYLKLLDTGISEEDARFILPTIKTNMVVSYNARSLLHFFKLRCCQRAQWEIREIAHQMLVAVRKIAPVLFGQAGPPCVTEEYCPEGELSCGRIEKIKRERGNEND